MSTVIDYLTALTSSAKVSTISRRATAIGQAHQAKGYQSPTQSLPVRALLSGIRKALGTSQKGKSALLTQDIRTIVSTLPSSLKGARDRAIILLGFAGAFRRSEIVDLDVSDLTFGRDGITVMLRRSKTDQEGVGRKVGIPYGSLFQPGVSYTPRHYDITIEEPIYFTGIRTLQQILIKT